MLCLNDSQTSVLQDQNVFLSETKKENKWECRKERENSIVKNRKEFRRIR